MGKKQVSKQKFPEPNQKVVTTAARCTGFGHFPLHQSFSIILYTTIVISSCFPIWTWNFRKIMEHINRFPDHLSSGDWQAFSTVTPVFSPSSLNSCTSLSKSSLQFSCITKPVKFHQVNFWLSSTTHLKEHQDFEQNTLEKTQHCPKQIIPMPWPNKKPKLNKKSPNNNNKTQTQLFT